MTKGDGVGRGGALDASESTVGAGIGRKVLFWTLLLGGVPPMASGVAAMFFHDAYFNFVGAGVPSLFAGPTYGLTHIVLNLQGGDAFVAGSARVIVAFVGSLGVMRLFAGIGLLHSLFEIWLLSQRLLPWCVATPSAGCRDIFVAEVWGFIGLHLVLVAGFSIGLMLSGRKRRA